MSGNGCRSTGLRIQFRVRFLLVIDLRLEMKNFSIAVIVFSFGFFFLGIIGFLINPDRLDAEEIRTLAEEAVPLIEVPPKPAGTTRLEPTSQEICTNVPNLRFLRVEMKRVCNQVPGPPKEVFVGPSNLEIETWEKQLEKLRSDRLRSVKDEIARIENMQRSIFSEYIKDMVQIGSGVFGMIFGGIGCILAFRKERRESQG